MSARVLSTIGFSSAGTFHDTAAMVYGLAGPDQSQEANAPRFRSSIPKNAKGPRNVVEAVVPLVQGVSFSANGSASSPAWGNAPGILIASERALKAQHTGSLLPC
jgi:hypothetical protein